MKKGRTKISLRTSLFLPYFYDISEELVNYTGGLILNNNAVK